MTPKPDKAQTVSVTAVCQLIWKQWLLMELYINSLPGLFLYFFSVQIVRFFFHSECNTELAFHSVCHFPI